MTEVIVIEGAGTIVPVAEVHIVVPDGIHDPALPSGGNTYDRQICQGLGLLGWRVREHAASGSWPAPSESDLTALARLLARIPDGGVVLLDGLIASTAPDVLVPESGRLRLVVLLHLPLGRPAVADGPADDDTARERAVLSAAAAVVVTSQWTRRHLLDLYSLSPERVQVAAPGVEAASLAPGSSGGGELLCVAPVAPHKGHDVLLDALARIRDLPWRCRCVGSLDRDPGFVAGVLAQARAAGISDRVRFTGSLSARDLDTAYATSDVLVVASRGETYGMVVTEALARGVPVIGTAVGGLPEALGHGTDGGLPGVLVPTDAPAALAIALREWLVDARLRADLRRTALDRRAALLDWSTTSRTISLVLTRAAT